MTWKARAFHITEIVVFCLVRCRYFTKFGNVHPFTALMNYRMGHFDGFMWYSDISNALSGSSIKPTIYTYKLRSVPVLGLVFLNTNNNRDLRYHDIISSEHRKLKIKQTTFTRKLWHTRISVYRWVSARKASALSMELRVSCINGLIWVYKPETCWLP